MSIISALLKAFSKKHIDRNPYEKVSYSQSGEDLIIDFVFWQLKIEQPSYIDIGAHHPQYLSNTFYFYKKGSRGVNIEPDPYLIEEFAKIRGEDKNLNIGIGFSELTQNADFYIMSAKTLNTFSEEEALRTQNFGTYKIEEVIKVPLVPINKVIDENFTSGKPNLLSLDVEGLDFEIIKSLDFGKYRPEVLCIETLTYSEDKTEEKLESMIEYVCSKGYFIYADTYINTIFVDEKAWKER